MRVELPATSLVLCAVLIAGSSLADPCFIADQAGLPQITNVIVEPGDFDADGDPDLVVLGQEDGRWRSLVLRNDGGTFADYGLIPMYLEYPLAEWLDWNADGDLDFILGGRQPNSIINVGLFKNLGTEFEGLTLPVVPVTRGDASYADFDRDGDYDLAVTGLTQHGTVVLNIYDFESGTYTPLEHGLPGIRDGELAWGDVDGDHDLDLILSGMSDGGRLTALYRNDDGIFVDAHQGLVGLSESALDFRDYDLDGDPDLAVIGASDSEPMVTLIYRNDGGTLVSDGGSYPGYTEGGVAWGDADGDGDLDLALAGASGELSATILLNESGTMVDSGESLPMAVFGDVAWLDYDGDRDFDLLLAGTTSTGPSMVVLRNDCGDVADAPEGPNNLRFTTVNDSCIVEWERGPDADTPDAALTSNLYLVREDSSLVHHRTLGANRETHAKLDTRPGNFGRRTRFAFNRNEELFIGAFVQTVDETGLASTFETLTMDPEWLQCNGPLEPYPWWEGRSLSRATVVDFDADRDWDLVIETRANGEAGAQILVALDQGPDLGLAQVLDIPDGYGLFEVLDFDSDGDVDFIDERANELAGFANSNGSFEWFSEAAMWSDDGTWHDADGDGDADLLVIGQSGIETWLRGDRGTYTSGPAIPLGSGVRALDVVRGPHVVDQPASFFCRTEREGWGTELKLFNWSPEGFTSAALLGQEANWTGGIWLDADADGDQDIIVWEGWPPLGRTHLLDNADGVFGGSELMDLPLSVLPPFVTLLGGVKDLNGDGRADLYAFNEVTRNMPSKWTDVEELSGRVATYLDVDGDGRLGCVLADSGNLGVLGPSTCWPGTNFRPLPPTNVTQRRTRDGTTFRWDAAVDPGSPTGALTYELRVGTTPGADDVVKSYQSSPNGALFFERLGNVGARTSITLPLDWTGEYWCSVQAIDAAYEASPMVSLEPCTQIVEWGYGEQVRNAAWADFDADGDMDVVVEGSYELRVYENRDGSMELAWSGGEPAWSTALDWGDYDGDGDLDLAAAWQSDVGGVNHRDAAVFENRAGSIQAAPFEVPSLRFPELAWTDFDNDGDLDLLAGGTGVEVDPVVFKAELHLLENVGGVLVPSWQGGSGLWPDDTALTSLDAVDIDSDGDQDVVAFFESSGGEHTAILENANGSFAEILAAMPAAAATAQVPSWADIDLDGQLDLLLAAAVVGDPESATGIFAWDGTSYSRRSGPSGARVASASDFDGDGLPELLTWVAAGAAEWRPMALKLFEQADGEALDLMIPMPRFFRPYSARLLDVNGDRRLDIYAAGHGYNGLDWHSALVMNACDFVNQRPAPPTNLVATRNGEKVTFSWDPGSDAETPTPGLSYNLIVGTALRAMDIMPVAADPRTGQVHLAEMGNVGLRTSWTLTIPEDAPLFWGVQSIDSGFLGSPFTTMTPNGVGTVVQSFEIATGTGGCARIAWSASRELILERESHGSWAVIVSRPAARDGWVATDCPDAPARYRLVDRLGVVFAERSFGGVPGSVMRPGIHAVRPNPFNPSTTIEYGVDRPQHMRIEIFDARGRRIRVLVDRPEDPGAGTVDWDGTDDRGLPVAGGVYFVLLQGETLHEVRKIALVK